MTHGVHDNYDDKNCRDVEVTPHPNIRIGQNFPFLFDCQVYHCIQNHQDKEGKKIGGNNA